MILNDVTPRYYLLMAFGLSRTKCPPETALAKFLVELGHTGRTVDHALDKKKEEKIKR